MIKIQKTDADRPSLTFSRKPKKGLDKLEEATKVLKEDYSKNKVEIDKGKKKFKFDSKLYSHKDIKDKLKELQHDKCCFCEAKVTHISHGDVEHFRPKAAYKQLETDDYSYPGYFWLVYDWDNLFVSCQLCNQRHKKNLFPLIDPTTRMLDPDGDLSTENPLLLHPVHDNPEDHIVFIEEVPRHLPDSIRGEATINSLGLDRPKLNELRREKFQQFILLVDYVELYPDKPKWKKEKAKKILQETISNLMKPTSEYSLMFKSLYKQRIKVLLEN